MNKKIISFLGILLVLLSNLTIADLTFNGTQTGPIDFGTVNQNSNTTIEFTLENPDDLNKTEITFSAGQFSYGNSFIGTYSFDGQVTFDPNNFNLTNGSSQTVQTTLNVPLTARMGLYTSTFTVTYNENGTPKSQDFTAKVFINQYTDTVGDLRIDSDSFDDIPRQIRLGRRLDMDIDVENRGSTDLDNVKVEAWLFDKYLNQIVAFDTSSETTIDDGEVETFSLDLDINTDFDDNHDYEIYVKAYKTDDELNQHDVEFKSIDVLGENDLCDVGDLDITEFDIDNDLYNPGDTVYVDIEVENKGFDPIDDVVVEVWLTERGDTRKIERDKSDRFDLDEDETETLSFELELDKDIDEGDYEVHAKVYESGNEDRHCYEEVEDIEIERPNHKVIIDNVIITPSMLTCGDTFSAQIDVQNIGSKSDDAVKVRMYNNELNIDVSSETFSLEKYGRSGDDETVFLNAEIPENSENKEYTLTFTLYYDELDQQKNYIEKITVANCITQEQQETTQEEPEETATDTPEDTSRVVYLPTGNTILDFLESNTAKTIFWIVADVALLIIAIYFIVALFRRKR
jgi:uncharacterized membrane protein